MREMDSLKPAVRSSNFELLRIVAMSMIVIHHFIVHILAPALPEGGGILSFVNTMVICGVNLFIMISGYFQIKFTWQALIKLWLLVGFYVVISRIGYEYYTLRQGMPGLSWKDLMFAFAMFTQSGYWFIGCYFVLMIFSPVLNTALNNMNLKMLRRCMLLLTLFTCYSGFVWGNAANQTGYAAVHFFYLYFLGYYVREEPLLRDLDRRIWLGLFFCSLVGYGIFAGLIVDSGVLHNYYSRLSAYNNPVILLASTALFCYFRQLEVQSKFINSVAASVFGVYIFQESALGRIFYEKVSSEISRSGFTMHYLGLLALTFLGLFVGVFVIDQLRKALCNPLARWIEDRIPQKFQLNFNENH